MKMVYVVVISERGTPETSLEGVFENFEDAERIYNAHMSTPHWHDRDDVYILQMPLNAAERKYV